EWRCSGYCTDLSRSWLRDCDLEVAAFGNFIGADLALFSAEMGDHVVRECGNLGIRIGSAECRHVDVAVPNPHFSTQENGLGDVGAVDIIDSARAQKGGVLCLLSPAIPLMTARAGSLEQFQ